MVMWAGWWARKTWTTRRPGCPGAIPRSSSCGGTPGPATSSRPSRSRVESSSRVPGCPGSWLRRPWPSWPKPSPPDGGPRVERSKRIDQEEKERAMPLRRRPVLRTVGRTAVIAGTASVVAGGVNRHQQQKYAQQDAAAQQQAYEQQAPVEQAPPPAAGGSDDPIEKLKELAQLK